MTHTFLTTEELSHKLKYDPNYSRQFLMDTVLMENIHYIRPFGRRRILFIWEPIEQEMLRNIEQEPTLIPMASGGMIHG
ncbi:MAG: hypothetical protein Q9M44_07200 [Ghiorsea sp.]|nr:hypothetical protein [Ghiorsea sp.]